MTTITVNTKEHLKIAIANKYDEIIVEGELAKQLHDSKKITMLSGAGLPALIALGATATITAPATAGFSFAVAAAPVVALTGLEIGLIAVAVFLGVGLILAVYKDYEEIEVDFKKQKIKLRRKHA